MDDILLVGSRELAAQGKDEFMILACDGIWDVVTSQQVWPTCPIRSLLALIRGHPRQAVDLVRERLRKDMTIKEILADLFEQCLSPHPSANEVLSQSRCICFANSLLNPQYPSFPLYSSAALELSSVLFIFLYLSI